MPHVDRRNRIAMMRANGWTISQISEVEGIGKKGVWHYTKDMPKVWKWTPQRAHNKGMRLGGWKHVTNDALEVIAKEMRGNETIIACMARLVVAMSEKEKEEP